MKNLSLFVYFIPHLFISFNSTSQNDIKSLNKRAFELAESDLTKAFKLSEKAEGMINGSTDSILISDVYSVRGTLYQTAEKYEQAILWHQKALGVRKRHGDLKKITNSKFNLANLYYQTENFKLSKEYHLESLAEILQTNVDEVDLITRYNSLGSLYKDLGKRDSALFYLNKSLKIIERNDLTSSDDAMNVYLNLGIVYEEQGEYQLSLQYLEKAIPIQKELENTSGLSLSYHHIGIVNELKREFPTAEKYYNMAMALAEKLGDVEAIKNVSFSKAKLFAKISNQDSTLYYFDKYADFSDKLQRLTQSKKILELDTQYKTKEKEAEAKNANERSEIYFWSSIIISLTFLLILFFLIRNYRQKQRIALLQVDLKNNEINDLLNQQENASYAAMLEGQDQERLRIARELHDRLGSTLATIKLGLQNEKIPEAQQQVALVNTAISEVRTISHDLSGGNIEQYGLAAALTELKHTLDRSGKITLNLFMEAVNIQASLHVTIYRIVQELVSNTLKHAEATEITLQLSTVDDQLNLIYEDNGKGFDLSHYQPGMGITNIRHRLEKWHGTIEIDAQPNRGTITILTVPITMPHD